jgi:acetylglutamate kinase
VNADEAAAALAVGLGADKLLFVTDVPGCCSAAPSPRRSASLRPSACSLRERWAAGSCEAGGGGRRDTRRRRRSIGATAVVA